MHVGDSKSGSRRELYSSRHACTLGLASHWCMWRAWLTETLHATQETEPHGFVDQPTAINVHYLEVPGNSALSAWTWQASTSVAMW